MLQNIETNEGGTLWCNPKTSKKVLKKSGAKVCFRGSGRLLFFLSVLDALLNVGVVEV